MMKKIESKHATLSLERCKEKRKFEAMLLDQVTITTEVTNPMSEWELLFFVELKSKAIGRINGLAPFAHEKVLFDFSEAKNKQCEALSSDASSLASHLYPEISTPIIWVIANSFL